jgi:hypothetical protein
MPKLPHVRRRRETTKREKAVRVARAVIAALPAIRLLRRGLTVARIARFGPAAGVVLALLALLKRRRARKAEATAPWDTSVVPASSERVAHGDKLAEATPSTAAAAQNGTTDSATPDPAAPSSRESLAEPPSTPAA